MNAFKINPTIPLQNLKRVKKYDFELPEKLQCAKPTEERGIRRDEVRLMISKIETDEIYHTQFKNLDEFLKEGDVVVVNTSGTLKAALEAFLPDGKLIRIHFSTKLPENQWVVEVREVKEGGTKRFEKIQNGEILALKNEGSIELTEPYYDAVHGKHLKLWKAKVNIPISVEEYLDHYGKPIRYNYIKDIYPQSYYQTVFAGEMGSAEMPSAGRAFTLELVTRLISKGVQFVPVLLHTGVASLESDERPYDEYFKISENSAGIINHARKNGNRIIATGTTAIRVLETVADRNGFVHPGEGWTNIFITPERGLFSVDGLLTGFHEPKASHLLMLEALAGQDHLEITYREALKRKYQWHEFGDLHLILP